MTESVLRRSLLTGVERIRCALTRPKHPAATRTPATSTWTDASDSVLTHQEVSAGKAAQAKASQKSVWKRPPKSSRL